MKIALFSLFSLLSVQVALSASLPRERPNCETELLNQSRKESGVSVFTNENEVSTRLNLFACFPAIRDIGSIMWTGFSLLRERSQIVQKAVEGRENCSKVGGNAEYLEKCLKFVEDEQKAEQEELNKRAWEIIPQVLTALVAMMKCLA